MAKASTQHASQDSRLLPQRAPKTRLRAFSSAALSAALFATIACANTVTPNGSGEQGPTPDPSPSFGVLPEPTPEGEPEGTPDVKPEPESQPEPTPEPVPEPTPEPVDPFEAWTCPDNWYDDTDCDCGCGAPDPACASPALSSCDFGLECGGIEFVNPADTTTCLSETGGQDEGACKILVCLTGAVDQSSASNQSFGVLCDTLANGGNYEILPDCDSGPCYSTWDNFTLGLSLGSFDNKIESDVYPALFNRLDTNNDGIVDGNDENCSVRIAGYSWGGLNSTHLAQRLASDADVAVTRRYVKALVALDPYQPLGAVQSVPPNVERYVSFRHSQTPANDCSQSAPLGPYKGIAPTCTSSTNCTDYDFSRAPSTTFVGGASGFNYLGNQIGHCEVPDAAFHAAIAALAGTQLPGPLPPVQ